MPTARPSRAPAADARASAAASATTTTEPIVVDGAQCEAAIARLAHDVSLGHAYVVSHAKARAAFFAREARALDAHASETCATMALDASRARATIEAVARADFDGVVGAMARCVDALEALEASAKPS